jgi:hypothetical protein
MLDVGSLVSVLKWSFHVQLFERILEIPVVWHKGRATGEVLPFFPLLSLIDLRIFEDKF